MQENALSDTNSHAASEDLRMYEHINMQPLSQ
jgi:hypothetical protein